MLEGVVSRNTHSLKSHHLLMTESLLGRESIFGRKMGLMALWPIPDEPPCYEQSP